VNGQSCREGAMKSRGWACEQELVDVLERRIAEKATSRTGKRARVFREFDAGFGRVDLLCVWYDEGRLAARQAASTGGQLRPFGLLGGYAMTFLRRPRWVRQDELRQALRLTRPRAARLVESLLLRGLVDQRDDMLRARPLSSVWSIEAIEAYEAKLDKWK